MILADLEDNVSIPEYFRSTLQRAWLQLTICMLEQHFHLPPGRKEDCVEEGHCCQGGSHALEQPPHSFMLQGLHRQAALS